MAKTKHYHILCLFDQAHGFWSMEFGSFDKSDVDAERQEARDHGKNAKHCHMAKLPCLGNGHAPRQNVVDQYVRDLNNSVPKG